MYVKVGNRRDKALKGKRVGRREEGKWDQKKIQHVVGETIELRHG